MWSPVQNNARSEKKIRLKKSKVVEKKIDIIFLPSTLYNTKKWFDFWRAWWISLKRWEMGNVSTVMSDSIKLKLAFKLLD